MFIVTLNHYCGSSLEASQPQQIWGPFQTEKEAIELEDNVNKWIEANSWGGERLAQTFEVNDLNFPKSADELRDILGEDDEEDDDEEV
jgi:hypothetical protein